MYLLYYRSETVVVIHKSAHKNLARRD